MASSDTLFLHTPAPITQPAWLWVAYTSGSTEPTPGDTIWGDTSNAQAILEILSLESGTWGGSDAAGYMLLSNWNSTAWTSAENFTANSGTPANHGTLTLTPVACHATIDTINNVTVYDFDDTANEVLIFTGVVPLHYDGGGITATTILAGEAATGDMSFKGFFRSFTDDVDNLLQTSFNAWGTVKSNTAIDAPSVVGEVTYDNIAFSSGAELDSLAAGEFYQFLLMRDAQDSTNDDMAGDASLVSASFKET